MHAQAARRWRDPPVGPRDRQQRVAKRIAGRDGRRGSRSGLPIGGSTGRRRRSARSVTASASSATASTAANGRSSNIQAAAAGPTGRSRIQSPSRVRRAALPGAARCAEKAGVGGRESRRERPSCGPRIERCELPVDGDRHAAAKAIGNDPGRGGRLRIRERCLRAGQPQVGGEGGEPLPLAVEVRTGRLGTRRGHSPAGQHRHRVAGGLELRKPLPGEPHRDRVEAGFTQSGEQPVDPGYGDDGRIGEEELAIGSTPGGAVRPRGCGRSRGPGERAAPSSPRRGGPRDRPRARRRGRSSRGTAESFGQTRELIGRAVEALAAEHDARSAGRQRPDRHAPAREPERDCQRRPAPPLHRRGAPGPGRCERAA